MVEEGFLAHFRCLGGYPGDHGIGATYQVESAKPEDTGAAKCECSCVSLMQPQKSAKRSEGCSGTGIPAGAGLCLRLSRMLQCSMSPHQGPGAQGEDSSTQTHQEALQVQGPFFLEDHQCSQATESIATVGFHSWHATDPAFPVLTSEERRAMLREWSGSLRVAHPTYGNEETGPAGKQGEPFS